MLQKSRIFPQIPYLCAVVQPSQAYTMNPIELKVHALRAADLAVGAPVSQLMNCADGGLKRHFDFVSLYNAAESDQVYAVSAFILEKYREMGEETGLLGYPLGDVEKDPELRRGLLQRFQYGWVGWSPQKGVYYQLHENQSRGAEDDAILKKYAVEAAFLKTYYNFAVACENVYKIPVMFTIAQSALETGWGRKTPANNMFGIKADKNWTGKKVLVETIEYLASPDKYFPNIVSIEFIPYLGKYKYKIQDWFRAYDSPLESFNDRALFLQRKRYEKAFLYSDPYNFAREIAVAGYATDPNYYALLANLITRLELIKKAWDNTARR